MGKEKEKKKEEQQQEQIMDPLEALQKELDEKNDLLLRTAAEYDNYRKRSEQRLTGIAQEAHARTIEALLLPVIDNLERAQSAETASREDLEKGVELTLTQLRERLTAAGVTAFGEEGEQFDPELHNAVMHIEDENLGENIVAQVLQKGYKIGDRVIRHAMVKAAN